MDMAFDDALRRDWGILQRSPHRVRPSLLSDQRTAAAEIGSASEDVRDCSIFSRLRIENGRVYAYK